MKQLFEDYLQDNLQSKGLELMVGHTRSDNILVVGFRLQGDRIHHVIVDVPAKRSGYSEALDHVQKAIDKYFREKGEANHDNMGERTM